MKEHNKAYEQWSAWMAAAQEGDKQSYEKLLKAIVGPIEGFLRARMGNQTEVQDITQNILLAIHKSRHTYDASKPFRPWLFSIVRYRMIDHFRSVSRKNRNTFVPWDDDIGVNQDEPMSDLFEQLHLEVDKLSQKEQTILHLMKFEGFSVSEIADKLSMSSSAVKVSAHRAYKKLRDRLEGS